MIKAATAVAARIVKNQYNRFPRRRKGLARNAFLGETAWLDRARGLGETLQIRQGEGNVSGRFLDLDLDGALVLETETGVRRITAGDVYFAAL